ncbi:MAG: hypothetical protein U9O78_04945 [Patescibacteria group bacterium]|nr:hypothetical protein [Patescibacteria group bacterium]
MCLDPSRNQSAGFKGRQIKQALANKDIDLLGEAIEHEIFSLHGVAMTSFPPVLHWDKDTAEILHATAELRERGISVYATIDAGPNVHLITESKNLNKLVKRFKKNRFIKNMYKSPVGQGAKITKKHLF